MIHTVMRIRTVWDTDGLILTRLVDFVQGHASAGCADEEMKAFIARFRSAQAPAQDKTHTSGDTVMNIYGERYPPTMYMLTFEAHRPYLSSYMSLGDHTCETRRPHIRSYMSLGDQPSLAS
jgi:hypothetical protein